MAENTVGDTERADVSESCNFYPFNKVIRLILPNNKKDYENADFKISRIDVIINGCGDGEFKQHSCKVDKKIPPVGMNGHILDSFLFDRNIEIFSDNGSRAVICVTYQIALTGNVFVADGIATARVHYSKVSIKNMVILRSNTTLTNFKIDIEQLIKDVTPLRYSIDIDAD